MYFYGRLIIYFVIVHIPSIRRVIHEFPTIDVKYVMKMTLQNSWKSIVTVSYYIIKIHSISHASTHCAMDIDTLRCNVRQVLNVNVSECACICGVHICVREFMKESAHNQPAYAFPVSSETYFRLQAIHRPGDNPLSEPRMVICVSRLQREKKHAYLYFMLIGTHNLPCLWAKYMDEMHDHVWLTKLARQ